MSSVLLSLPELAQAAGVHLRDANRYLALGLLQPRRRVRSRSGYMAFHKEHVDRLRFIREALDAGFSIGNIATLIDPDAMQTCGDVYALAKRRVHELREEWGQGALPAAILEQLADTCARNGSRTDCALLTVLSIGHKARSIETA